MLRILRKVQVAHLPISDIHMLTATSPCPPGLQRRERIRPCRPWTRLRRRPPPHSPLNIHALFRSAPDSDTARQKNRRHARNRLQRTVSATRSEERRVGKECRSLCDWSSDVCSSDLTKHPCSFSISTGFRYSAAKEPSPRPKPTTKNRISHKIGRASCRERV